MKFIQLNQGSQEWLSFRKSRIGASDCPVIMGISPYLTPYKLWLDKMGDAPQEENAAMARGKALESQALKCFEDKTGLCMFPKVVESTQDSFLIASLDGIDLDQRNIVEIKCNGQKNHAMALSGSIPIYHYAQVQHQLMCTGLEMAYYFSYDGHDGVIIEVEKAEPYIKLLVDLEKKFYDCMINFDPPKLTDKDFIVMNDLDFNEKASKLIELRNTRKLIEQEEEYLTKYLIEKAKGKNVTSDKVQVTKVLRKGSVDYGAIPLIKGIDLEQWRKDSTESWRITEKRP